MGIKIHQTTQNEQSNRKQLHSRNINLGKGLGFGFVFTWPAGFPQQNGAPITEGP